MDTLDPYTLVPGALGGAQVHVLAGTSGDARVVLSLDPQDGTDPVLVELQAEIGTPPQPSILATIDSTESNAHGGNVVEFGFYIFNATDAPLNITLKRTETEFPDTTWSTTLCYFGACIDPAVNSIPVTLQSHKAALFAVQIGAGNQLGTTGEVEVEVVPGDNSESTYHRFAVTVDRVSGLPSSTATTESGRSLFFPNPTAGSGTIHLPLRLIGKRIVVSLFDREGRLVRVNNLEASTGSTVVDVRSLPAGSYRYQVQSVQSAAEGDQPEQPIGGSFILVR